MRREDPDGGGFGNATLTPLVDALTLILLFLLRSWSMDPPVVVPGESFTLPRSVGEDAASPRLTVDVGATSIRLAGRRVTGTAYYTTADDTLVRELYDAALQHAGQPVALRVDAGVPWGVVRKVMFTLREAGLHDVELIAESRTSL